MLRRLASLVIVALVLGFIAFAVTLPRPAGEERTDAVVALTGGENRIARGLDVLRRGWAGQLLVAGVDPEVTPAQFAAHFHVEPRLMACCVTLGYESVDTRTNGQEVAKWVALRHPRSLRLVTSDWHMRRAMREMHVALPHGPTIVADAVPTRPSLDTLFAEYLKLLARQAQILWQH